MHGLGGSRTIRGYRLDRFVGPAVALANVEVRWTMFDVVVLKQRFAFAPVAFIDVGRVFDSFDRFTFRGWKRGEGVGMRIAWNQATVGAFDLGFSSEDTLFYTEFNHPF
jgi:hemolysin activation/secretion protein